MSEEEDNALYTLAFGEDGEVVPARFQSSYSGGVALKMVRFLARRVYNLEKGVR